MWRGFHALRIVWRIVHVLIEKAYRAKVAASFVLRSRRVCPCGPRAISVGCCSASVRHDGGSLSACSVFHLPDWPPLADPLFLQLLIDRAWPQRNAFLMLELAFGIGLCFFARSVLYSAGSLINFSISQRCIRELRIELLDQMNRLSEDYHLQTPTGEKLARMEHDVDEIANLGADTANQSIRAILFFVLYLGMMAKLNFSMTLTLLPLFPLFAFVQRHYRAQLKERADDARSEIGSAASILNEHLSAVPQIQLLGAEEATTQRGCVGVGWDAPCTMGSAAHADGLQPVDECDTRTCHPRCFHHPAPIRCFMAP